MARIDRYYTVESYPFSHVILWRSGRTDAPTFGLGTTNEPHDLARSEAWLEGLGMTVIDTVPVTAEVMAMLGETAAAWDTCSACGGSH